MNHPRQNYRCLDLCSKNMNGLSFVKNRQQCAHTCKKNVESFSQDRIVWNAFHYVCIQISRCFTLALYTPGLRFCCGCIISLGPAICTRVCPSSLLLRILHRDKPSPKGTTNQHKVSWMHNMFPIDSVCHKTVRNNAFALSKHPTNTASVNNERKRILLSLSLKKALSKETRWFIHKESSYVRLYCMLIKHLHLGNSAHFILARFLPFVK